MHALALILLSLAKMQLSLTLTFYPSRSGALDRRICSFFFWQSGSGVLAYCSRCGTGPLFPFQQAQCAEAFLLKPAPFCKFFAVLGNTNKSATSLFFSSYLTLVLSLPPSLLLRLSFYLKRFGRSGRNCLLCPSVLSSYSGSSDTRFFR